MNGWASGVTDATSSTPPDGPNRARAPSRSATWSRLKQMYGYACSEGYDVQVIAPGEPRVYEADGLTCRFVKPP